MFVLCLYNMVTKSIVHCKVLKKQTFTLVKEFKDLC